MVTYVTKRRQRVVLVTGTHSMLMHGDTLAVPEGRAVASLLRRGWKIVSVSATTHGGAAAAYLLFEKDEKVRKA